MKIILILLNCVFILILVGCNGTTELNPFEVKKMREIAWESLEETVIGDWRKAEVTSANWEEIDMKNTKNKPKRITRVVFKTSLDGLLGPIGIYIDTVTNNIVGYDARM